MKHAPTISCVALSALAMAAPAADPVILTFDKVETGKPVSSYTDKGVVFTLAHGLTKSKGAGKVMFFPHLKTSRKGILNAIASESIPVQVRFPKPVSSVTLVLWGSIGSAALVEAYDKDGQVVDKASREKVPERTGPEQPIPSFELTVKAAAISSLRFSGAPPGGYLVCDEVRFTPQSEVPPLKEAFKGKFLIGVAFEVRGGQRQASLDIDIATTHFSAFTPENSMKPMFTQPAEGRFNFAAADRLVELAQNSGATPIGHCLVWHSQTPRWFFQGPDDKPADRDLALARMRKHIATVVGHYKGRVKQWDVVNEAISDKQDQLLRPSPWLKAIGEDYIAEAFRAAHKADPDAILIYNDFGIERRDKRHKALELLKSLRQQKVPIHAVGIQGHWRLESLDLAEVEESIKQFAALGLKVMITELDISVLPRRSESADISRTERPGAEQRAKMNPYAEGLPDSVAQQQAERYRQAFAMFLRHKDVIGRVTFWGIHDGRSWLNFFPIRGRTDYPLLFDRQGQPKPAFFAVRKAALDSK
ncbi:MAG TPA: endo-1,4-beta-xylanase [Gemmataceae bacterium]|nr:endo-1,4-beta-xylanase [Gemmataceae bacterium]